MLHYVLSHGHLFFALPIAVAVYLVIMRGAGPAGYSLVGRRSKKYGTVMEEEYRPPLSSWAK